MHLFLYEYDIELQRCRGTIYEMMYFAAGPDQTVIKKTHKVNYNHNFIFQLSPEPIVFAHL